MSDSDETARALAAANALEAAMVDLSADIKTLRSYGQRNRLLTRVALVMSAVLVVITFALFQISDEARQASSDAALSLRSQKTACKASNDARRLTRQLWTFVLDDFEKTAKTDAGRARLDGFRSFVDSNFADRDCAGIE